MKQLILMVLLMLGLFGCAFPQSPADLRTSGTKGDPVCLEVALPVVAERLRQHLNACYRGDKIESATVAAGGVPVSMSGSLAYRVEEEVAPGSTRFLVRSKHGYIIQVEASGEKNQCATFLEFRGVGPRQTSQFKHFAQVSKGQAAPCDDFGKF